MKCPKCGHWDWVSYTHSKTIKCLRCGYVGTIEEFADRSD